MKLLPLLLLFVACLPHRPCLAKQDDEESSTAVREDSRRLPKATEAEVDKWKEIAEEIVSFATTSDKLLPEENTGFTEFIHSLVESKTSEVRTLIAMLRMVKIAQTAEEKGDFAVALRAYEEMLNIATKGLSPDHHLKISAAIQVAALYRHNPNTTDMACDVGNEAYDEAIGEVDMMSTDLQGRTKFIAEVLRLRSVLVSWRCSGWKANDREEMKKNVLRRLAHKSGRKLGEEEEKNLLRHMDAAIKFVDKELEENVDEEYVDIEIRQMELELSLHTYLKIRYFSDDESNNKIHNILK